MLRPRSYQYVFVAVAATLAANCASRRRAPDGLWPRRPLPTVRADLATAHFDSVLPFDRPFVLRVKPPDKFDAVYLQYGTYACMKRRAQRRAKCATRVDFRTTPLIARTELAADIEPLPPNNLYTFTFTVLGRPTSDATALRDVAAALKAAHCPDASALVADVGPDRPVPGGVDDALPPLALRACLDVLANGLHDGATPAVVDTESIGNWTSSSFKDHFDVDFGALYSFQARYWGMATLVHLYAEPVQPNEQMDWVHPEWRRFWKRVNVAGGLSLLQLGSRAPVKQKFAFGSPVAAVGFSRLPVLTAMRVNGGLVWLTQDDANPLVTKDRTKIDPFVSLTFDYDIRNILGPIGGLLGLK